jgi:septal ring factor EnvC (AmiA/AmiB activator)
MAQTQQQHRPSGRIPDEHEKAEHDKHENDKQEQARHAQQQHDGERNNADERAEAERKRAQQARQDEEKARDEAEAQTAHLPKQGEPRQKPMTPAEVAAPGEGTRKMQFPVGGVTLTLPGYRMVHFPEGIQEVPESLVEHEYFKAHDVRTV